MQSIFSARQASASELPRPRAVIFDWDNTLVNTWPVIHHALCNTFIEMGQEPWPIETTMERVGKSMRDAFPDLFGDAWQEAAEAYQRHYRTHHLAMLEALPGAEESLKALKKMGVPALIVSNKKGHNLRAEVRHLAWEGYFASMVGADDAARDKPYPDPVLLALGDVGMAPAADIWFIGDSEIDLEAAAITGCTPLLYGPRAGAHTQFSATHFLGYAYAAYAPTHGEVMHWMRPWQ